jgi:hypothetical protein
MFDRMLRLCQSKQNAPRKTVFGAWSAWGRPGAQVSTAFRLGTSSIRSTAAACADFVMLHWLTGPWRLVTVDLR